MGWRTLQTLNRGRWRGERLPRSVPAGGQRTHHFRVISDWKRGSNWEIKASQQNSWIKKYEQTILPRPICNLACYFCVSVLTVKKCNMEKKKTSKRLYIDWRKVRKIQIFLEGNIWTFGSLVFQKTSTVSDRKWNALRQAVTSRVRWIFGNFTLLPWWFTALSLPCTH